MTIYFSAFFREYFAIGNNDQRLQYKQDFNTEYEEYRQLHETIDSVAKKFLNLELLRKETRRDSLEFEVTDRNSLYIIKFFELGGLWFRLLLYLIALRTLVFSPSLLQ